LKSKFLFAILAVVTAAIMPLVAASQVAPDSTPRAEETAPTYKYSGFLGFGYTSLNQVNLSRYGLMGTKVALSRDFGRYFDMTANGGYYKYPTGTGNPGDPSVWSALAGPEGHAEIWGRYSGLVHVLIGVEHSGGEGQTPNISFAGGFGGGVTYKINDRFSLRASGDRIGASFSLSNNTPQLAYSPHIHWNARGEFGVVYHF
jgi:hypothetical protein